MVIGAAIVIALAIVVVVIGAAIVVALAAIIGQH